MLTPEEQERLAYIQGDLAKAELLQALLDAQEEAQACTDELDAYHNGFDDGYEVGLEEGKNAAEHEGSTCD